MFDFFKAMAGSPYCFGILLMALKNTQLLVGMATLTTFVDFSPPWSFVVSGSLLVLPPAAVVPLLGSHLGCWGLIHVFSFLSSASRFSSSVAATTAVPR